MLRILFLAGVPVWVAAAVPAVLLQAPVPAVRQVAVHQAPVPHPVANNAIGMALQFLCVKTRSRAGAMKTAKAALARLNALTRARQSTAVLHHQAAHRAPAVRAVHPVRPVQAVHPAPEAPVRCVTGMGQTTLCV